MTTVSVGGTFLLFSRLFYSVLAFSGFFMYLFFVVVLLNIFIVQKRSQKQLQCQLMIIQNKVKIAEIKT